MAFTAEIIPECEKDAFPFPVYKNVQGETPTLWKWMIDRERDAYLVTTKKDGGPYDGFPLTEHLVLAWKGEYIFFIAEPGNEIGISLDGNIHYLISNLNIPPCLTDYTAEIKQIIYEALSERGWLYNRKTAKTVALSFKDP